MTDELEEPGDDDGLPDIETSVMPDDHLDGDDSEVAS